MCKLPKGSRAKASVGFFSFTHYTYFVYITLNIKRAKPEQKSAVEPGIQQSNSIFGVHN